MDYLIDESEIEFFDTDFYSKTLVDRFGYTRGEDMINKFVDYIDVDEVSSPFNINSMD